MRILSILAKCSDLFSATLRVDGKVVGNYDGYVPRFMPGEHYGDYVTLDINVDTGEILNWRKPKKSELDEIFPKA